MTSEPAKNFGKRRPVQPMHEEAPSRKRSNHVALLLMGTMALGGGAYALMPSEHCDPNRAAIAGQQQECQQRSSSSSSGGHGYSGGSSSSSGRSNFASTGSSSSGGYDSSSSSSSHVTHGGFGSFASHFSGGG
ncbi:hypothetical protein AB8B21_00720 [Tardiphaga sp. 866_E4_N2_1]|jgi:hypothetical protein|uniref:hypothetical protein n=1 Tax=unclassified Tardiphaga TaxID=2631404 RepID=UPI003F1F4BB9